MCVGLDLYTDLLHIFRTSACDDEGFAPTIIFHGKCRAWFSLHPDKVNHSTTISADRSTARCSFTISVPLCGPFVQFHLRCFDVFDLRSGSSRPTCPWASATWRWSPLPKRCKSWPSCRTSSRSWRRKAQRPRRRCWGEFSHWIWERKLNVILNMVTILRIEEWCWIIILKCYWNSGSVGFDLLKVLKVETPKLCILAGGHGRAWAAGPEEAGQWGGWKVWGGASGHTTCQRTHCAMAVGAAVCMELWPYFVEQASNTYRQVESCDAELFFWDYQKYKVPVHTHYKPMTIHLMLITTKKQPSLWGCRHMFYRTCKNTWGTCWTGASLQPFEEKRLKVNLMANLGKLEVKLRLHYSHCCNVVHPCPFAFFGCSWIQVMTGIWLACGGAHRAKVPRTPAPPTEGRVGSDSACSDAAIQNLGQWHPSHPWQLDVPWQGNVQKGRRSWWTWWTDFFWTRDIWILWIHRKTVLMLQKYARVNADHLQHDDWFAAVRGGLAWTWTLAWTSASLRWWPMLGALAEQLTIIFHRIYNTVSRWRAFLLCLELATADSIHFDPLDVDCGDSNLHIVCWL